MKPELVNLQTFINESGALTVMEKIPFDVKRVFWLHDLTGWRGGHAHKECHQLIVAVHGNIIIKAGDMQTELLGPCVGLHVPPGNHVELFGPGAVVLVLCSEYYDEDDYVYPVR